MKSERPARVEKAGSARRGDPWHGVELLRRIGDGEEEALEELHHALADRLFSMALAWLGDRGAAGEVVNDTFLRIWRRAGQYDAARSQPFTWCVMLMRGLCFDRLRKLNRRPEEYEMLLEPTDGRGLEDLMFHETISAVGRALEEMGDDDRRVLSAALFDPAETAVLARRWGLAPGGARTRIHRAMLKLRELLKNQIES